MPDPHSLSLTLKAKLFRGLADPSRLAIVEVLRTGEKTVSEIVAATKLSQPNASAHLACLKDCGLVESRQEGKFVFYTVTDKRMEALMKSAEGIISVIAQCISCCANYECKSEKRCVGSKQCASSAHGSAAFSKRTAVNIALSENPSKGRGR